VQEGSAFKKIGEKRMMDNAEEAFDDEDEEAFLGLFQFIKSI
jgi:hypothetical protein